MMNIILKLIVFVSVFSIFFISCDDENPEGALNTDVSKMVSFSQDTFLLKENVKDTLVTLVVPRYVNGVVKLVLGCEDGTGVNGAKRDTNFYIDELETKIKIGASKVDFPIEIYDDTLMNADRFFTLELLSATGAASVGTTRQKCVIRIVNDDFPKEATAMFSEPEIEIYENGGEVAIPFKIMKGKDPIKLKGDASVTFASAIGVGSAGVEEFKFKNGGKVSMKKGDSEGVLFVEIFNNDKKNPNRWASIYMSESEGVFHDEKGTCKLTIKDDDIERTMGFSVAEDSVAEDAGSKIITVKIEGKPKFDKPVITGTLAFKKGGSLRFEGDSSFSVRGDTTLTFKAVLDDNTDFGTWQDTIYFKNVANVTTPEKTRILALKVLDNERKLDFEEIEYNVLENAHQTGSKLYIPVVLEGGVAIHNTNVKLSIIDDNTLEGQYELTSSDVVINKGARSTLAEIRVFPNSSPLNTSFKIHVSTDQEHTTVSTDSICTVNIVNIDPNVQFSTVSTGVKFNNTKDSVYVQGFNLATGARATLEVTTSEGLGYLGSKSIPLKAGDDKFAFAFNTVFTTETIHTGTITMKIVSVLDEDNVELENVINPVLSERIFYVIDKNDTDPVDLVPASAWEPIFVTTEEPVGEGEGNGMAKHMLDANTATFWHTQWNGEGAYPAPPYTFVFDMKNDVIAKKIEILARSGDASNFHCGDLYVGNSPEVNDPSWVKVTNIDNKTTPTGTSITDITKYTGGRYLKFVILEAKGGAGGYVAAISELKLYGYDFK